MLCHIGSCLFFLFFFFFFNDTATTEIYTLSLHDALPISPAVGWVWERGRGKGEGELRRALPGRLDRGRERQPAAPGRRGDRSEEHTSELQSRLHLVCRLLLEKKKNKKHCIQPLI